MVWGTEIWDVTLRTIPPIPFITVLKGLMPTLLLTNSMCSSLTSSSGSIDVSVAGSAGPAGAGRRVDKSWGHRGMGICLSVPYGVRQNFALTDACAAFQGNVLDGLRGLFQPKGFSDCIQMSGIKAEMNTACSPETWLCVCK